MKYDLANEKHAIRSAKIILSECKEKADKAQVELDLIENRYNENIRRLDDLQATQVTSENIDYLTNQIRYCKDERELIARARASAQKALNNANRLLSQADTNVFHSEKDLISSALSQHIETLKKTVDYKVMFALFKLSNWETPRFFIEASCHPEHDFIQQVNENLFNGVK